MATNNLLILAEAAAFVQQPQSVEPIHLLRRLEAFPVNRRLSDTVKKPKLSALPTNLEKESVQQNVETKRDSKLFQGPGITYCSNLDSFSKEKICSEVHNVAKSTVKSLKQEEQVEHYVHDHNYFALPPKGSRKRNKASTGKSGKTDAERVTLQRLLPQFLILTPPFPYVHGSSDFQVTEKCEIHQNGEPVNYIREITVDPQLYSTSVISSVQAKKQNLSHKKRIPRSSNKVDVTGSVLECVENRVDIKLCQPSTSKGINLDLGNISENSENLQRTNLVKRRAEELIKNLTHTKKKNGYPKVLPCGICTNKRFTSRSSLRSHLRSHAGIKPFKCLLCLKTFTRQQSLNYHTKVHSNENDHTCLRCGRGFRHPNHFKEHLRLHTGETPYSCPECEKRFTTRNTFKRHLRAIHKKVLNRHGIEDLNPDDTSKV